MVPGTMTVCTVNYHRL